MHFEFRKNVMTCDHFTSFTFCSKIHVQVATLLLILPQAYHPMLVWSQLANIIMQLSFLIAIVNI